MESTPMKTTMDERQHFLVTKTPTVPSSEVRQGAHYQRQQVSALQTELHIPYLPPNFTHVAILNQHHMLMITILNQFLTVINNREQLVTEGIKYYQRLTVANTC
eukprot:2021458-Amphidinium_carterae.1